MPELIYKDESYAIIGACFEVYNDKGYGFTEPVYQECLQFELGLRGDSERSASRTQTVIQGKSAQDDWKER